MNRRQSLAAIACLLAYPAVSLAAASNPEDSLLIDGKTGDDKPHEIPLDAIRRMPAASLTTRSPWYDGPTKFEGVLARDLIASVGARGEQLSITAFDGYAIDIPLSDLRNHDAILAYRIGGADLTIATKGPLFLIYPFDAEPALANEKFYSRCIWQIAKITIL